MFMLRGYLPTQIYCIRLDAFLNLALSTFALCVLYA